MFEQVKGLDLFKNYTQSAFNQLLSKVNQQIYDTLSIDQGTMTLTPHGMNAIFMAVKEWLTPELCEAALRMAIKLARADEASEGEKTLLLQMAQCLDIDSSIAQSILR
ncbi:MAG: hypothetical protein JXB07_16405 [Anaerolineae bacterium]|nr:hypothetical protein [Anaerolineae bacterium]